ncbi:hypothetical protein F5X99DRAFT_410392 [Biscogniauxia marginata]|nr:hypothetical protein F5X99DRAFT_410392 [Biscogniauxia marginata]
MEPHRLPKRSASHGTLRSSYSSHGRPGRGPSPVRPLHKPLRSVNENSVLLPSPGALESMLKTTTETGDIGIFSIKPVPLSPQRRDAFSDLGKLHPPPRRSIDDLYRRDNARRPPYNRDTTSEIISMYGTESQKSGTSTLSPTFTEYVGQRSYSMTTCGSRHLSHHKSTATLQSQASGSHLQRPRSPFPYPTRLKRPGVRPASPALTENGRVDYSRMVEIDRISYRTVHGPYKPAYSSMPRRPPLLGLRADANQSTPSLLLPGPPPNYHGPPPQSVRTHSAASMNSWNTPRRERLDSASSRTSSLTSIVNMYHRMPPALRPGANGGSAPTPRYYDYTEDFESKQARAITPTQPLAPVPTRAPDCQRPSVLQESDDHLAAVFGGEDSAFLDPESQSTVGADAVHIPQDITPRTENDVHVSDPPSPRCYPESDHRQDIGMEFERSEANKNIRGSDIDLLPSQVRRDSIDTFNPSLDLESRDMPTYNYTSYRVTTTPKTKINSPERQVQVLGGRVPTIRSEQGVILRDDTQDEFSPTETIEGTRKPQPDNEPALSLSGSVTESRSCSEPVNEPSRPPKQHEAILDCRRQFASAESPSFKCGQLGSTHSKPQKLIIQTSGLRGSEGNSPLGLLGKNIYSDQQNDGEQNTIQDSPSDALGSIKGQQFRRHKRNQAVLRISTASLPREDNQGFPRITPSCSNTPLISPKPISPARQLKVKNSIPQLMKALPPLPGDPDYISPPTPNTTSEEDEFAELLAPFSFPRASTPKLYSNTSGTKSESSLAHDRVPSLQKNLPKPRLKLKMSNSSGAGSSTDLKPRSSDNDNSGSNQTPDTELESNGSAKDIRVRTRNRLKLRSSKSTGTRTPPEATVRRNPEVAASGVISDLARHPPRDLFAVSTGLSSALHQVNKKLSQAPQQRATSLDISDVVFSDRANGQPKRRISSTYSIHTGRGSREKCTPPNKDSHLSQPRGLKRHMSNLRALLARSSDPSACFTQDPGENRNAQQPKMQNALESYCGILSADPSSKNFASTDGYSSTRNTHAPFRLRIRKKLTMWVRGAKSAVRNCAHKKRGT